MNKMHYVVYDFNCQYCFSFHQILLWNREEEEKEEEDDDKEEEEEKEEEE